ncbi:lactate dehydrogenase-like 2-hydroxyacid dehydrogenase [Chitinophaga terrae (ex Kim and Jung 2007)]|uniref:2-hydroxyacid dehydrogenase n=1 Tax=Chitinophaga terrae (ex Kim and Jung 2007) TaxID=408074 RepID=UPI00278ADA9E|nr:D-glycerate dehydrogenase [Chitinophaga terrae (ex Kim and Jung 2007)]MDQ0108861.1 lactate dehydrogenase-like 2-hydroxyacid dehydrogenase [Chitinophaga terrae (ex Kim and Jung 2007)]
MKVFATRIIPAAGLELLEKAGHTVTQWTENKEMTVEERIAYCKDHDALLFAGGRKIDRPLLENCRHMKVVSLLSVGYDNVDLKAATELGIQITNTPGVLSNATADTAFLLMLSAARKAFFHHKRILNGEWNFSTPTANLGVDVEGKTLGVWGLGNIGYVMAQRCKAAFGMDIIYHNRRRNEKAEKDLQARYVSFDELLQQSDVLSVHVNLTAETRDKFNMEVFRKMKPTAIFINAARGGIHNEPDLAAAIEQGIIWGAGLDVTNPEPMQPDNPLLQMPTVAVLPHIGSATQETRNAMARVAAENIIAALAGKPVLNPVNHLYAL